MFFDTINRCTIWQVLSVSGVVYRKIIESNAKFLCTIDRMLRWPHVNCLLIGPPVNLSVYINALYHQLGAIKFFVCQISLRASRCTTSSSSFHGKIIVSCCGRRTGRRRWCWPPPTVTPTASWSCSSRGPTPRPGDT